MEDSWRLTWLDPGVGSVSPDWVESLDVAWTGSVVQEQAGHTLGET